MAEPTPHLALAARLALFREATEALREQMALPVDDLFARVESDTTEPTEGERNEP